MSRFTAAIAILLCCTGCSLLDEKVETEDRDEDQERAEAAAQWIQDLEPLLEANQELEDEVFTQMFQVNCGQGPLSADEREKAQEKCAEINPGGEPVAGEAIARVLEEELIPDSEALAGDLEDLDLPDDELEAFHNELVAHWSDRVTDYKDILDAWKAEDMVALETAFERRMRNRRAAGQWLLRVNQELAELGLLLEL